MYVMYSSCRQVADADLLKPWQLSRERYKARKKAVGDREKDTLARLNKFQAALRWVLRCVRAWGSAWWNGVSHAVGRRRWATGGGTGWHDGTSSRRREGGLAVLLV